MGVVLGLCGEPGAGKTEVRKILSQKFNFSVINSKIAIYKMASELTGLDIDEFINPDTKNNYFNGIRLRTILAECGYVSESLFGRTYLIQQQLEANKVSKRLERCDFVIDSLRMNQPTMLYAKGLIDGVLHIVNPAVKPSEQVYDEYDLTGVKHIVVMNDGSLEELTLSVKKALSYFPHSKVNSI